MRFNLPLCLSLLGALVSFSSVAARSTYSHDSYHNHLSERDFDFDESLIMRDYDGFLDLRDEGYLDLRSEDPVASLISIRDEVDNLYEALSRRAFKISSLVQAAKKAVKTVEAGKHGKAPTPKGAPKTAKHAASQAAANQRKADKKQAGRDKYGAAAKAHKATTNLPGTHQKFNVPNGGPTHTGKEVKKAVFDSHMEREANKGKSKTQLKKSPLKDFGNSAHREPHANKPNDKKSINHMTGKGHEFPIGDPKNKGPSRVITQQTKDGHTKFQGVVAHDVTRAPGSNGYNDHFQVKPSKH